MVKSFAWLCMAVFATMSGCQEVPQWTPPKADVRAGLVEATSQLLGKGLDDPRGGEYRDASVRVGNVWNGGGEPVAARGWVSKDGKRIVCWNGLAYPPVTVGEKRDLRTDIEGKSAEGLHTMGILGNAEAVSVASHRQLSAVSLLLVAGEIELAEKLDRALGPATPEDAYLGLATQLLFRRWDRAIAAHMRGDDTLAAADARLIASNLEEYRATAKTKPTKPYAESYDPLAFLNDAPVLAEDSERRLAQGDRPKLDPKTLTDLAQPERIRRLIENLDEATARQSGQPGGVGMTEDPIVWALVEEGDAAVDALLDTAESDKRLTRSVSFDRDFHPQRHLWTVGEAAASAFFATTKANIDVTDNNDQPITKRMRAWWQENRGYSAPERWMRTLAADQPASDFFYNRRAWMGAASNIVRRTDVIQRGTWVTVPDRSSGKPVPPMAGEALRAKQNPSLAELMAKRAIQLAKGPNENSSDSFYSAADGAQMAAMLHEWDGKKALPVLQEVTRISLPLVKKDWGGNAKEELMRRLAIVIDLRITAGDHDAYKDLEVLLANIQDENVSFGFELVQALRPLWKHPNEDESKRLALKVFRDSESPWNMRTALRSPRRAFIIRELLQSPLMEMPIFREEVQRILDDRTPIGEVWLDESGHIRFEVPDGASGGLGTRNPKPGEPGLPPAGEKKSLRIKDLAASAFTHFKGAPDYLPVWPTERRDRAVKEMKAFVAERGASLYKESPFNGRYRD